MIWTETLHSRYNIDNILQHRYRDSRKYHKALSVKVNVRASYGRPSVHLYILYPLNRLIVDLDLLHMSRSWPWLVGLGDWRSRSNSWFSLGLMRSVWSRSTAVCFLVIMVAALLSFSVTTSRKYSPGKCWDGEGLELRQFWNRMKNSR